MKFPRRLLRTSFLLFALSQILFLSAIQVPEIHNFDEFHYVPAAKQFLQGQENHNWEHPPLGKELMAVGIGLWGDRPIGWRFMSTIFGSLTLVGMYVLAWVLFQSESIALWVALVTLFNHLLYVQARIGMLDTFMFAFLVWGLVGFCASWSRGSKAKDLRSLWVGTGLMLGLSAACKWFAFVPWVGCILIVLMIRLLQKWRTEFQDPKPTDWYRPDLWKGMTLGDWILSLGAVPLTAYFITFIPVLLTSGKSQTLFDLFGMQLKMWKGQHWFMASHNYMSHWTGWLIPLRPIWYTFSTVGPDKSWNRGVLLLGNPLVMWTGLLAVGVCAWDWITRRRKDAFLIFFFYVIFYGCWAFIGRNVTFYYYYYPAGMMLSLALGYFFYSKVEEGNQGQAWKIVQWAFLGATFCLFAYFFPILAGLKIPAQSFRQWMWFRSWI